MSSQRIKAVAIAALEKEGRVSPDALVRAAKNKNHPLHKDFPWDDRKAAHQHRLDIAREIISSVRVTITTETQQIRSVCYVRDPSVGNQQGYVSVAHLRSDSDLASEALLTEVGRVVSALERAREYAAAVGLIAELEVALRSAMELHSRARRGPMGQRVEERRLTAA